MNVVILIDDHFEKQGTQQLHAGDAKWRLMQTLE